MEVIGERLDYLWFLDYGLDDEVPNHSVLSKARARWGKEVFESLFVRTVAQCVEAGLKSRISIRFFRRLARRTSNPLLHDRSRESVPLSCRKHPFAAP